MARGDRADPVDARTKVVLGPLSRALEDLGATTELIIYADDARDEVREQLRSLDGVLVWINPIHDGANRAGVDALLREIAAHGIWVSAHPDVISKMGTKEVLFHTRHLSWGTDAESYRSPVEFADRFPARLRRSGRTVLKAARGNGGNGVWRVDLVSDSGRPESIVRVLEARADGASAHELSLAAFIDRCGEYFAWAGPLIAQPYVERLGDGMIRCYLVHGEVVGFCHQWPRALLEQDMAIPPAAAEHVMEDATTAAYQSLRAKVEDEWVPQMQKAFGISTQQLPAIWDADFLFGPKTGSGEDTYVLCEINASAVWPFPQQAVQKLAAAAIARTGSTRMARWTSPLHGDLSASLGASCH
jgi:hypothetical protein